MASYTPDLIPDDPDAIRETVKKQYGEVAAARTSCCGGGSSTDKQLDHAERIGYSREEVAKVPDANLGLGCGNPTALAALSPGEVVLDLGAGAGIDAFIAAEHVGADGRVIGIDMTPEMLQRARENAVKTGHAHNVEFREGLIEKLPVVESSVDVVISNCVINLSPDKPQVFREAFRVLKPGGRLAVSDILLTETLPEDIAQLASAYAGCLAGAMLADDYLQAIEDAGFVGVRWTRVSAEGMVEGLLADPTAQAVMETIGAERVSAVAKSVWSYKIEASKA